MEIIALTIEFDNTALRGQFINMEAARRWVVETLDFLLDEYTIMTASRIVISRSS